MSPSPDPLPWYRHFWPWFLVVLLLVVILACLYTVYLTQQHPVSLVKQDYYKEGLAVNQDLSRQRHAAELGLQAVVLLADSGRVTVDLQAVPGHSLPLTLDVQFDHPLDDARDIALALPRESGGAEHAVRYASEALTSARQEALTREKRWYVYVSPAEAGADWILQGEVQSSLAAGVILHANPD